MHLPDQEIPYEEFFYRKSDAIVLQARTVELVDRGYKDVTVRLSPSELKIGDEIINPENVTHLEAVCAEIVLPREAMGLGDVKFMAAIGAFIGWQGVIFSLMVSSIIGAAVGIVLIVLRKREWSSRMPYGPYIALAAVIWIFGGKKLFHALCPSTAEICRRFPALLSAAGDKSIITSVSLWIKSVQIKNIKVLKIQA